MSRMTGFLFLALLTGAAGVPCGPAHAAYECQKNHHSGRRKPSKPSRCCRA